jgi:two-component system cell cycle response regulator DivK
VSAPPRVLLVDDNASNLKLLTYLLAKHGYDLNTAGSGAEALALVPQWRPALILLDLQMPGIDGFEVARRLKSDPDTNAILIVAVTAYAMKGDEEKARAAGCDAYLTKPIDTRALPGVVAGLLQRTPAPNS